MTGAALVATGLDYAWSKPSPAAIAAGGYRFACRYLSYDTAGKNLTADEVKELAAVGVAVVCNWEYGTGAALNGYAQGAGDAREAQRQALACGMPADRPIYFSVDFNAAPTQQSAINSYFDGVASVLGRSRVGAYGGYWVISRLFNAGKITWGWQTYGWSGGQWDSRAQLRQVANGITVGGADCDRNEAWATDYGQWGVDTMTNGEFNLIWVAGWTAQRALIEDADPIVIPANPATGYAGYSVPNLPKQARDKVAAQIADLKAQLASLAAAGTSVDTAAVTAAVQAASQAEQTALGDLAARVSAAGKALTT